MVVSRKICCALFSCYLRFKIRPFALSPTKQALALQFSSNFCKSLRPAFLENAYKPLFLRIPFLNHILLHA